jgi:polo-like kinase 1
VQLSPQAKGLITRLLVTDPSKRPSLDEILANDFLNQGNSIPKLLPAATLSCPPSKSYLDQFQVRSFGSSITPDRLLETAPISTRTLSCPDGKFANTERNTQLTAARLSVGYREQQGITIGEATTWVTKWVDYSSKYGMGYQMNNGTIGVFFNDATKILLGRDECSFLYAARAQGEAQDKVTLYSLTDFPKDLLKKVTLLQHFRSYLDYSNTHETRIESSTPTSIESIFVKKWTKTKHAILFRLTNKSIQIIFQDSTELLLSSDTQILTYRDKQGIRSAHLLAQALESSNQEMAKRLKYMKDILAHMLGKQEPGGLPRET